MCKRCDWVAGQFSEYIKYHDEEWGVPVHNDKKHFEFLIFITACFSEHIQHFLIILSSKLTDYLSGRMAFEISHRIRKSIFFSKPRNKMNMIGHYYENKNLNHLDCAQVMRTI